MAKAGDVETRQEANELDIDEENEDCGGEGWKEKGIEPQEIIEEDDTSGSDRHDDEAEGGHTEICERGKEGATLHTAEDV